MRCRRNLSSMNQGPMMTKWLSAKQVDKMNLVKHGGYSTSHHMAILFSKRLNKRRSRSVSPRLIIRKMSWWGRLYTIKTAKEKILLTREHGLRRMWQSSMRSSTIASNRCLSPTFNHQLASALSRRESSRLKTCTRSIQCHHINRQQKNLSVSVIMQI